MLAETLRIWTTLMVRDIRTRRGETRIAFVLNIIEPIGQLMVIYLVFTWVERRPAFGPSLFVFLLSGIIPYFLCVHCVGRIASSIRLAQPYRMLQLVSPIDLAIATMLLETLTITVAATLVFVTCWAIGVPGAVPYEPEILVFAVIAGGLTALGVGLVNGCIIYYFPPYRLIWTLLSRSLVFFSGLFPVIENLPASTRAILLWNPILHVVIWFRSGVFRGYPQASLDLVYLFVFIGLSLLLGLALERLVRRSR